MEMSAVPVSESDSAVARSFRETMSGLKLVPDDEWNDGLILAEVSIAGIPLLVTSDCHLLSMEEDVRAGLASVHPVSPRRLLHAFR